jgi:hypothetical protein
MHKELSPAKDILQVPRKPAPCIQAQDACKLKGVTRISARLRRPSIATDPAEDHSIYSRVSMVAYTLPQCRPNISRQNLV